MKPPALGKLAATGAVLGPACDAIHNQSLLQYDVLPIGDGIAKTSLLIPPLLALTYALLGGVFPAIARRVAPGAAAAPLIDDQKLRTIAAVVATCSVIKLSAVLIAAERPTLSRRSPRRRCSNGLLSTGPTPRSSSGSSRRRRPARIGDPVHATRLLALSTPDYFPFGPDLPRALVADGPLLFCSHAGRPGARTAPSTTTAIS